MLVLLVRHGETEWSRSHRHTGRTDVPLTDAGREQARRLAERLGRYRIDRVLTSPLSRARETCELAGLTDRAEVREELREWDYGDCEGRTTEELRRERGADWTVWSAGGCPGGETLDQLGERAGAVARELRGDVSETVALFAHGHVLRVLAARWIGLGPEGGALLALSTASLSALGLERETPVVRLWNDTSHLDA